METVELLSEQLQRLSWRPVLDQLSTCRDPVPQTEPRPGAVGDLPLGGRAGWVPARGLARLPGSQ